MAYRDQLNAAMQRLAKLEAELAEARKPAPPSDAEEILRRKLRNAEKAAEEADNTLAKERKRLRDREKRAERLQEEVDEANRKLAALRNAYKRGDQAEDLPTLTEYNRGFDPIAVTEPSGVLCPRCMEEGNKVEMMKSPIMSVVVAHEDDGTWDTRSVLCPRCAYLSLMRKK